jgi:osmotically-inducible protein OsmY
MADNRFNNRNAYISFRKQGGYNTPEYYRHNRALGEYPSRYNQEQSFPEHQNDNLNTQYDNLNTGKYENYGGAGYYGSNYGAPTNLNRGRDYEQNAGYRSAYNTLDENERKSQHGHPNRNERTHRQADNNTAFRGKGPRSYQRSDIRITEDINDRLYEDPYVDATDIEVQVTNGEVVLTGAVDDRNAKRRVEDLCENVSGVKHVENRLRARKPGGQIVNIQNSSK